MSDREDIRDEFSPLLDDELSPDARDAVETALAQDAELLRELDRLRKVDELYRSVPRASAPADLAERVRAELHPPAAGSATVAARSRWNLYSGLAAAAMFGVVIGGLVLRQEFVVSTPPEQLAARQSEVSASSEAKDEAVAEETPAAGGREQDSAGFFAEAEPSPTTAAPSDEAAEAPQDLGRTSNESEMLQDAAPDAADAAPEVALTAQAPPPPPPAPMPEAEASREAEGLALADAQPMQKSDADDGAAVGESRAAMRRQEPVGERQIGDRTFERRDDVWYQDGYEDEPTRVLRRDVTPSTENPIADWERLLAFEQAVIFKHADVWYRIPPRPDE
jgi:hypothetical protein